MNRRDRQHDGIILKTELKAKLRRLKEQNAAQHARDEARIVELMGTAGAEFIESRLTKWPAVLQLPKELLDGDK